MHKDNFHFGFGDTHAITLFDSVFETQADEFFVGAPDDQREQAYAAHGMPDRRFRVDIVSLYLDMGSRRVIVDTGVGPTYAPCPGQLPAQLASEGITAKDVDVVILSHAHFDHIWGNTDAEGWPAFPNARYFIGRQEYERVTSVEHEAQLGDTLQRFRQNLQGIRERLDLVEPDSEILPGIRTVAAPGHTWGQLALVVTSGAAEMLYLGDAVHHAIHMEHPDWYYVYDAVPTEVAPTRRRLLEWAAQRKALVYAPHLPPAGAGHILPAGDAWRWEPLQ